MSRLVIKMPATIHGSGARITSQPDNNEERELEERPKKMKLINI